MPQVTQNPSSSLPHHAVFTRVLLKPLMESDAPYVSEDYLRDSKIRVRRIDFYSGAVLGPDAVTPDPTEKPLMRPGDFKTVEGLVDEYRPLIEHKEGGSRTVLPWDDAPGNDWWHAFRITLLLEVSFKNYDQTKGDERLGMMYDVTDWECLGVPSYSSLNQQSGNQKWAVMSLYRKTTAESDMMGILCNEYALQEGSISTPEMRAILTLACGKVPSDRQRTPVTVVSIAGKCFRIVLGMVDSTKDTVEVHRSQIIDFTPGEIEKRREWLTVLCWMLGDMKGRKT